VLVLGAEAVASRRQCPAPTGDPGFVVVDHNNEAAVHEDLRLTSLCWHHIIANSSFSWWGAWLNP
jgi:hypothetical protein